MTTPNQRISNGNGQVPVPALPESDSEMTAGREKRRTIVALLRGYFATPVIAALGELGIDERMLEGELSEVDLSPHFDPRVVGALFRYLVSIGLLQKGANDKYGTTSIGRAVLRRHGASSLLMSYADYFHNIDALIQGTGISPTVNRLRNVRGSGQLHGRKFFPAAFELLTPTIPTSLIDVGCGDGCFIEHAIKQWPGIPVVGVDISPTAVETTKRRLRSSGVNDPFAIAADGFEVAEWAKEALAKIRTDLGLVISFWFVAHEFSKGQESRIVTFFSILHQNFPQARILLGEITRLDPETLANDHDLSIMPEFLLFHELSGQGVLRWETWRGLLKQIPYRLTAQRTFDEVSPVFGDKEPASFLWLLEPR